MNHIAYEPQLQPPFNSKYANANTNAFLQDTLPPSAYNASNAATSFHNYNNYGNTVTQQYAMLPHDNIPNARFVHAYAPFWRHFTLLDGLKDSSILTTCRHMHLRCPRIEVSDELLHTMQPIIFRRTSTHLHGCSNSTSANSTSNTLYRALPAAIPSYGQHLLKPNLVDCL